MPTPASPPFPPFILIGKADAVFAALSAKAGRPLGRVPEVRS